jgi:hypothetical protein
MIWLIVDYIVLLRVRPSVVDNLHACLRQDDYNCTTPLRHLID